MRHTHAHARTQAQNISPHFHDLKDNITCFKCTPSLAVSYPPILTDAHTHTHLCCQPTSTPAYFYAFVLNTLEVILVRPRHVITIARASRELDNGGKKQHCAIMLEPQATASAEKNILGLYVYMPTWPRICRQTDPWESEHKELNFSPFYSPLFQYCVQQL